MATRLGAHAQRLSAVRALRTVKARREQQRFLFEGVTMLAEAVAAAPRMGSTGSRMLSGNSAEWMALESEFAEFAGTEAALYFGSGYAANVGLLSSMLRRGDVVFSDALNHASLIDGMRLSGATKVIYLHVDLAALEEALESHPATGGARAVRVYCHP